MNDAYALSLSMISILYLSCASFRVTAGATDIASDSSGMSLISSDMFLAFERADSFSTASCFTRYSSLSRLSLKISAFSWSANSACNWEITDIGDLISFVSSDSFPNFSFSISSMACFSSVALSKSSFVFFCLRCSQMKPPNTAVPARIYSIIIGKEASGCGRIRISSDFVLIGSGTGASVISLTCRLYAPGGRLWYFISPEVSMVSHSLSSPSSLYSHR